MVNFDPSPPRLLLVRFSSLGDVVLLSALIEAASLHPRRPELWLATKARYATLFQGDPRLERIVTLDDAPGAWRRFTKQLETVSFDGILDGHGSLRSRRLCWSLPPAPVARIRKDTLARWLFLSARVRHPRLELRLVDRYRELLVDQIGPGAPRTRPRLHLRREDMAAARARLAGDGPFLAVAPGARHATKRWPASHFAEAARRLEASGQGPVVVLAGPGEEALGEVVASALQTPVRLFGSQPLGVLAAALGQCRALVSNDSGLMHMAEAVGTPVLGIFGPTSREWGYFPMDPRSKVLEHRLPCRPCSRKGDRPCHMPERWCLTRTTPAMVCTQVEELWSQGSQGARAANRPAPGG